MLIPLVYWSSPVGFVTWITQDINPVLKADPVTRQSEVAASGSKRPGKKIAAGS